MFLLLAKLVLILVFSYGLGKISDHLIKDLEKFSVVLRIGRFEMTAIVLALATTLPEMSVSISSSIKGLDTLAYGNAIGSNIANLSLILGMVAVAAKSLHFYHKEELRENFLPLMYTLLPLIMSIDGKISRIDGMLLLGTYGWYIYKLINKDKKEETEIIKNSLSKRTTVMLAIKTISLIALMLGLAQIVVTMAKQIAVDLNLPIIFVGLFVVSVGTSLPELFFNIKASRMRKIEMSMGSIVGSCVANATLITGISALINPIVFEQTQYWLIPALEYAAILVLLTAMVKSKHRLDWWEGGILVGLFIYYTAIELWVN